MSTDMALLAFLQSIYTLRPFDEYRYLVLRSLQNLIPFDSGAFFLLTPGQEDFTNPVHFNLDDRCFTDYEQHYQKFDLYKEKVFSQQSIPVTDRSSDYLNYPEWEKNEHRADFLLKYDMYHIACAQLFNEGRLAAEISLHRNHNQHDYTNEEMRRLQLLAPHLQNSLANQFKHRETANSSLLLEHVLGDSKQGLIVLDQFFKPILQNKEAELWLSVWNSSTRRFFWQELRQHCRFLTASQDTPSLSTHFTLNYPFSFKGSLLQVRLYHITESSSSIRYYVCELPPYKVQPSMSPDFSPGNLTPKEYLVYTLLIQGKSNLEIADTLSLSIHTIKTHLKNILQKCEVKSRVELISKLVNKKNTQSEQ